MSVVSVAAEVRGLRGQKVELDGRPHGLRVATVALMRDNRAEWALQVQLCIDLQGMPIEDASVPWPEASIPYVTVARLVADPQLAYTGGGRRLFFSPWRGLAAHQPLGNVTRARKLASEQSAQFRAERDGRRVEEPASLDFLDGLGNP